MKIKQNNQKGFTIIEVLIVLAIAGLIMLIVFLAVPALQRNSRNTQRKNDVSGILGSISEYVSNNGGKVPSDAAAVKIEENVNLGFYDTANVAVFCLQNITTTAGSDACTGATYTVSATNPDLNEAHIVYGAKCVSSAPSTTGASLRNIVVMYRAEASSGAGVVVCTES